MGRTATRLTLAAGLMVLAAALQLVSTLIRTAASTTLDWVTLALLAAAALGVVVNAVKARRSDRAPRNTAADNPSPDGMSGSVAHRW